MTAGIPVLLRRGNRERSGPRGNRVQKPTEAPRRGEAAIDHQAHQDHQDDRAFGVDTAPEICRLSKVGLNESHHFHCHCERSEAIQSRRTEGWIASLRSQ